MNPDIKDLIPLNELEQIQQRKLAYFEDVIRMIRDAMWSDEDKAVVPKHIVILVANGAEDGLNILTVNASPMMTEIMLMNGAANFSKAEGKPS